MTKTKKQSRAYDLKPETIAAIEAMAKGGMKKQEIVDQAVALLWKAKKGAKK